VRLKKIEEFNNCIRSSSRFTSKFWQSFLAALGIQPRMSTAFHPETDGQTERLNQTIETYLRSFVNLEQSDWVELLPLAEFAYNNSKTTATGYSPFYANYGYNPASGTAIPRTDILPVHSKAYRHWMKAIHDDCEETLEKPRDQMKRYADDNRIETPNYKRGDLVMLNGKNIRSRRPCKKLDHKLHGPFEIQDIISKHAVRLTLPTSWKIHPVFHVSLLEPFVQGNRTVDIQQVLKSSDPIEGDEEYDVDDIMGSIEKGKKVLYLVRWKGWPPKKDWTRKPHESFYSAGAKEEVRIFHSKYPEAPRDPCVKLSK
jgi:hypothetical protein